MIKIKSIYDPASKDDGKRIFVDRLWLRGVKKEKAAIDEWMKDIANYTSAKQNTGARSCV